MISENFSCGKVGLSSETDAISQRISFNFIVYSKWSWPWWGGEVKKRTCPVTGLVGGPCVCCSKNKTKQKMQEQETFAIFS